jgi:hypothetical protein
MTPSDAHEALAFFEGSWTIQERAAAARLIERCAWLNAGRRHMICHSTWQVTSGPREGVSIFSFRASDSTYLYYGLRPSGAVEHMSGQRTADGFVFTSATGEGATRQRTRVTIRATAGAGFRFVAESSVGDGPWKEEGVETYVRIVPSP